VNEWIIAGTICAGLAAVAGFVMPLAAPAIRNWWLDLKKDEFFDVTTDFDLTAVSQGESHLILLNVRPEKSCTIDRVDLRFVQENDEDVDSSIIRIEGATYGGRQEPNPIQHPHHQHSGACVIEFPGGLRCVGGKDVLFRARFVAVEPFKGKLSFEADTREYYSVRGGRTGTVQTEGP
jgi:hypothetical protein